MEHFWWVSALLIPSSGCVDHRHGRSRRPYLRHVFSQEYTDLKHYLDTGPHGTEMGSAHFLHAGTHNPLILELFRHSFSPVCPFPTLGMLWNIPQSSFSRKAVSWRHLSLCALLLSLCRSIWTVASCLQSSLQSRHIHYLSLLETIAMFYIGPGVTC